MDDKIWHFEKDLKKTTSCTVIIIIIIIIIITITIIITSIKKKINILIAQIPCEYDQMRVTNVSTKGLEFRTWLAQSVNDKRVKVIYWYVSWYENGKLV